VIPTFIRLAGIVAPSLGVVGLLIVASGAAAGGSAALGSDTPSWSPDGSMIAYAGFRKGRTGDIYAMPAYGGREIRLTATRHHDDFPRWSPDGRRIAFVRTVNLVRQLIVMNADGSGQRQLTDGPDASFAPSWSPDGGKLVFTRGRDDEDTSGALDIDDSDTGISDEAPGHAASDIYVLDVEGGGEMRLTSDPAIDSSPAWSPDGRLIVFTSNRGAAGAHQLFVMRADGSGQHKLTDHPVSYHSEKRPAWSADGSTIAFVTDNRHPPVGNAEIYLVGADGRNTRRLTYYIGNDDWPSWSPDGQIAIARGLTLFRPEVHVLSARGGLGARKLTGKYLSFASMRMSPAIPRASRPFTVELVVRPAIDGFTDVECRATLGDQLLVDPVVTRRGSLRCAWNLPSYAKGRMLRGVVLASTGGSEVTRTFALRVR
jgi:TolB protein